jgi:hypothetical protein
MGEGSVCDHATRTRSPAQARITVTGTPGHPIGVNGGLLSYGVWAELGAINSTVPTSL